MSALKIRVGGVTKTVPSIKVMLGGALRTVRRITFKDKGVLRVVTFTPTLSASASPPTATGGAFGGSASTGACTAIASGGLGPFSYAWALLSYTTPAPPSADAPATATTTFTGQVGGNATFRVTVTDSLGSTAQATVAVSLVDFS